MGWFPPHAVEGSTHTSFGGKEDRCPTRAKALGHERARLPAVSSSDRQSRLWLAGSGLKRAIRFATYDWTREMPLSLRVITMIGMGIQGYAIWAALSRSLIWPIMWPSGVILYATILLIYYIGFCIQNATLASELIRKTQLESEQLRGPEDPEDPAAHHHRRDPGLRSRRVLQAAARRGRRLLRCRRPAGQSHALRGGRRVRQGHAGRAAGRQHSGAGAEPVDAGPGRGGAGVADQPASVPVHARQPVCPPRHSSLSTGIPVSWPT